jgi:hypothetical protein
MVLPSPSLDQLMSDLVVIADDMGKVVKPVSKHVSTVQTKA